MSHLHGVADAMHISVQHIRGHVRRDNCTFLLWRKDEIRHNVLTGGGKTFTKNRSRSPPFWISLNAWESAPFTDSRGGSASRSQRNASPGLLVECATEPMLFWLVCRFIDDAELLVPFARLVLPLFSGRGGLRLGLRTRADAVGVGEVLDVGDLSRGEVAPEVGTGLEVALPAVRSSVDTEYFPIFVPGFDASSPMLDTSSVDAEICLDFVMPERGGRRLAARLAVALLGGFVAVDPATFSLPSVLCGSVVLGACGLRRALCGLRRPGVKPERDAPAFACAIN